MPTPAPFVIQPKLTSIALAYKNEKFIADEVMPRVSVPSKDFKYSKYTKEDLFTIPDTKVGRTSKPNEIDWSATEQTDSVRDYGLEVPVPQDDIDAAVNTVIDPLGRPTELVSELLALDREKRVADLLTTLGTYDSNFRTTLSGTTQWSDYTNSDPANAILTAMDTMLQRPNTLIIGRAVATKLRMHPKLVQAIYGTNQTAGIVGMDAVARLLELDRIIIGEGWYNANKKGQTSSMVRLWGKHAILAYINPNIQTPKELSFGVTAEWNNRVAGSRPDPDIGLRGGQRVRVGESVKELILAQDCAYFFQNAVA